MSKTPKTEIPFEQVPAAEALGKNIIEELKERMGHSLLSLDQLRPPEGVATGIGVFDDFFLWRGLPKGDLTLLHGKPGTGATSLWLQTAAQIHKCQENGKKWVAWVNSESELMPGPLLQRKIDLRRLLVVKQPAQASQLFWTLQEMISSGIFEMIGCHWTQAFLKNHQIQKLKKLARIHQVALVLISHLKQVVVNPLFALIIECHREFYTVRRALHRPTPFTIAGSMIHADLSFEIQHQPQFQTGGVLC